MFRLHSKAKKINKNLEFGILTHQLLLFIDEYMFSCHGVFFLHRLRKNFCENNFCMAD